MIARRIHATLIVVLILATLAVVFWPEGGFGDDRYMIYPDSTHFNTEPSRIHDTWGAVEASIDPEYIGSAEYALSTYDLGQLRTPPFARLAHPTIVWRLGVDSAEELEEVSDTTERSYLVSIDGTNEQSPQNERAAHTTEGKGIVVQPGERITIRYHWGAITEVNGDETTFVYGYPIDRIALLEGEAYAHQTGDGWYVNALLIRLRTADGRMTSWHKFGYADLDRKAVEFVNTFGAPAYVDLYNNVIARFLSPYTGGAPDFESAAQYAGWDGSRMELRIDIE